ncbi:hypothetical protein GWI34_26190 [Actinomadura sp. DSM 109109]|nr:hypothetical protein [Actinomadura lepetitiana]
MSATQNPQSTAATLKTQTGHADGKVNVLAGLSVAGLGFVFGQVNEGPVAARILLCVVGVALTVAVVCLLVVIYPREGALRFGTSAPADGSRSSDEEDELKKIVCLKFRCIQLGVKAMAFAVVPFLAALIVRAAA